MASIQLMSNHKNYFEYTCAEELSDFYETDDLGTVQVPKNYDTVREIFLLMKLPALELSYVWKNNLVLEILDTVRIKIENDIKPKVIKLEKAYFENLLDNDLKNFQDVSLLRNISFEDRSRISKVEHHLIVPLKISNFVQNPSEILMLLGSCSLEININNKGLVENSDTYYPNIKCSIKVIGTIYTNEYKTLFFNQNLIKNQKI